jgi:hypothetical protein
VRLHNRQIKASFWTDPDILQWPREKRWFYIGLAQLADDSGCLENSPFAFKIQLFPSPVDADITIETIEKWCNELVEAGKLVRYQADGKPCLYIKNFHKHQTLKNCPAPDVPLPPWLQWVPFKSNDRNGKYVVNEDALTKFLQVSYKVLTNDLQPSSNQNLTRTKPEPKEVRESTSGSSGSQASGLAAGDSFNVFDTRDNEENANDESDVEQTSEQRDHTTFWRDPGEIPNEEAFRELPTKQQLNMIVKEHQRLCPEQYKRFGVGGISKARDVFAEAIAGGIDAWRLFIQVAFWDLESDGPDPPPWEVVRPLRELGPGPDQITEQYLRYTMDRQAATEGVQVCGSTAVKAL